MTPCASLGPLGKKRKMAQRDGGLDAATDGFHVVLCSYSTRCTGLCLVLERRLVSVRIHTRLARRAELNRACSVLQDPLSGRIPATGCGRTRAYVSVSCSARAPEQRVSSAAIGTKRLRSRPGAAVRPAAADDSKPANCRRSRRAA